MTVGLGAREGPPGPFPPQVVDVSAVREIRTEVERLTTTARAVPTRYTPGGSRSRSWARREKSGQKTEVFRVFCSEAVRLKTGHAELCNLGQLFPFGTKLPGTALESLAFVPELFVRSLDASFAKARADVRSRPRSKTEGQPTLS